MTGCQLFGGKSWWVPHVGRKCSLFSEHLILLHLGSFMIAPIHYKHIIYFWICQSYDYVYGVMTGLSRTYFIIGMIYRSELSFTETFGMYDWNIQWNSDLLTVRFLILDFPSCNCILQESWDIQFLETLVEWSWENGAYIWAYFIEIYLNNQVTKRILTSKLMNQPVDDTQPSWYNISRVPMSMS